jgi:hypothetical protein
MFWWQAPIQANTSVQKTATDIDHLYLVFIDSFLGKFIKKSGLGLHNPIAYISQINPLHKQYHSGPISHDFFCEPREKKKNFIPKIPT